jgi:benzoyl-CoA reductase/2-hydroxyglutaryl-CoA dehydratase subunit BcrC/BadD/HgdB
VQRLYYYLCERRRAGDHALPDLLFYDLLLTPGSASAEHSNASLLRLRDSLNPLALRAIDDATIEAAIAVSEERRVLLQRCLEARRRAPSGLSGVEAQHVLAAARALPPREFIRVAGDLAAGLSDRSVATRAVRIVLAGNCPDAVVLHAALESLGAIVVGDYHDRGEPAVGAAFDAAMPPLQAITARYRGVFAPRTFPSDPEALTRFAKDAGAQGVVFFFFREEEVLSWDYPGQMHALAAAGIPSICLAGQPRRLDLDAVRETVSLTASEAAS